MQLRRILVVVLVAAAAALAAHGIATAPVVGDLADQVELTTLDWRVQALASTRAHTSREASEVVLVLFDSATVESWPYLSPFPRAVLADLIEVAAGAGARAIGVDVFLERRYPELDVFGDGDARLREAIRRAGNVILVAPTVESGSGLELRAPDPYFAEVAAGIGAADLPTPHETVRDVVLTVRTEQGLVPGFSLALYALGRGTEIDTMLARAERTGRLRLAGLPPEHARLPQEQGPRTAPILFVGPPSRTTREDGAFRAFSSFAVQMLGPLTPAEWFRDKIVLLGTGFHAEDRFRTPFYGMPDDSGNIYGWTYGIEVHANALENLLSGRHPVPLGTPRTLALLLLLALTVAAVTFARGVPWGAAVAAAALALVAVAAVRLFDAAYLHVPLVSPALASVLAFLGSTSYVSIVEGRDKRMIRGAFAKYVSPTVVDDLVADPTRLKLGGEKRTISVLFSDLAGFTSLSESLEPEALLSLLNDYLDEMADIVLDEAGTLDKYIGDAIMALYGAPTSLPDHALRACRTALRMQRRLEELNREWPDAGRPRLHMRIGINTGTPVVGNIGGEKRFDYTALGDAVNLAARLEPACKSYGVGIMIAEDTREAAGDAIVVRELERLAVYGKAEPVRVYELVALAGEDLGARAELLDRYEQGLAAYRERDFELAIGYFQAAAEVDPTDRTTALYLERCRDYLVNPPPTDWDAVERRQVK